MRCRCFRLQELYFELKSEYFCLKPWQPVTPPPTSLTYGIGPLLLTMYVAFLHHDSPNCLSSLELSSRSSICRVFGLALLYFCIGTIHGSRRGARGLNRLPHSNFWLELPSLVKVRQIPPAITKSAPLFCVQHNAFLSTPTGWRCVYIYVLLQNQKASWRVIILSTCWRSKCSQTCRLVKISLSINKTLSWSNSIIVYCLTNFSFIEMKN